MSADHAVEASPAGFRCQFGFKPVDRLYRLFHLPDEGPIGIAGVELLARATVHGDELHARRLGLARD